MGVLLAGSFGHSDGLVSKIFHITKITWMLQKKDLTAGPFFGKMRMLYGRFFCPLIQMINATPSSETIHHQLCDFPAVLFGFS
jgi:hypothetical protein